MAFFAALRLLAALSRPGAPHGGVEETLVVGGESLRAVRHRQRGHRGRLLLVHGLTPRGVDDPRMLALGGAFSRVGFDVMSPELPDLKAARLTSAAIPTVQGLCAMLGQPWVLAPSFAAGLVLRAVAEGASVRAVCAIGGYGDVQASVARLCAPDVDAYARVAVALNVLTLDPAERAALEAWLYDDSVKPTQRRFPEALARVSDAERLLQVIVGTSAEFAAAVHPLPPALASVDVCSVAARIAAPVTLIHGANDRVIPAAESRALARVLPNAHLCVTPLVSHGDAQSASPPVGAVVQLARAFAFFIGG